ncbi:SIR2 family protein [Thermoproteota archaeon]
MVVLFLGAGASAPFGYPVMSELNNLLLNSITDNEGDLLYHFYLNGNRDAETVIQSIQTLENIEQRGLDKLFNYVTYQGRKNQIGAEFKKFIIICKDLHRSIEAKIFDTYQFNPNISSIFPLYQQLFTIIKEHQKNIGSNDPLEVYTTNYDRIIEEFSYASENYSIYDGFEYDSKQQRHFWNPEFSAGKLTKELQTVINLYKLHGSLNWKKTDHGIERVTLEIKNVPRIRDLLIYPGSKSPPEEEPFRTLYEKFENQMKQKNKQSLLVIGFSFRDPYINKIIRDFIRSENGKLIVVSKNCKETLARNLFGLKGIGDIDPYIQKGMISPIQFHFGESDWAINLVERLRNI